MLLVLSTIPHICSILPLLKYYKTHTFGYTNTIVISTLLSILYHLYEESNHKITFMDYFGAGGWVVYDIYMGYFYTNKNTVFVIILVNALSFFINRQIPYNLYYPLNHSLWHLINAYKCYYVSNSIGVGIATTVFV